MVKAEEGAYIMVKAVEGGLHYVYTLVKAEKGGLHYVCHG